MGSSLGTVDKYGFVCRHWKLLTSTVHNKTVHCFMTSSPTCAGPEMKPILQGNQRTWRVWLDTNQYQQDMEAIVKGAEVCACSL